MSTSTDALLWYGYCQTMGSGINFLDRIREKLQSLGHSEKEAEENTAEIMEGLVAPFGCKIIYHCSDQDVMYGLTVNGTELVAWRGHPLPVEPEAHGSWDEQLAQAADAIGWPKEAGPRSWWLASWWG